MTDREIEIARQCIQTYIDYAAYPTIPARRRAWYAGAAAAVHDFLCRCGHGDAVDDLSKLLADSTNDA